jgi:cytochrome c biogenesis protein CcmG, thiol:disulfide interchange protein DsbE
MGAVRVAIRMVGMAAILALVFFVLVGDQHPLEQGTPAPPTQLRMLDGNIVDVPFVDAQPMFVNLWATWCPPCLQEMPELQKASERYAGRVRFVGFAVQSKPADIRAIVQRFGVTYPVGEVVGSGEAWHADSLPSSYLVGTDGKVLWSIKGAIDGKTIDQALGAVLSRDSAKPR